MGENNLFARLTRGVTPKQAPPARPEPAESARAKQLPDEKNSAPARVNPPRKPSDAESAQRPAAEHHTTEASSQEKGPGRSESIEDVMRRVRELTGQRDKPEGAAQASARQVAATLGDEQRPETPPPKKPSPESAPIGSREEFVPAAPDSFIEAKLTESEVEALVLKFLLSRGDAAGRDIADQIALPFRLVEQLMIQMKREQLVGHRGSAPMNDYVYLLSDVGRERARRYASGCSYFGAAPVAMGDYIASVKKQSLNGQKATEEDLKNAFSDLLIEPQLLQRLGPAINSGRGMFLFGAAGNGKTSIAERVTGCFGKYIWIPRALGVDGDVIRLFDPVNHIEAPLESNDSLVNDVQIDKRWIRIERPTIVVGGELTMENLEVALNASTGISEAPMQLKSNCGTLVIDDFGRQRMSVDELLNRWIVPLEKRYDFLNLASGKKLQVPFDQLVIFSTNLEPRDLVDEAFLRRIPYKIEAIDPSEQIFRELFKIIAPKMGIEFDSSSVDYLIEEHYRKGKRPYRNCHPRDLLLQIRNLCAYKDEPVVMTPAAMDFAVDNYFSVM